MVCSHSGYVVQIHFNLTDFFGKKIQNSNKNLKILRKAKKFVKVNLHSCYVVQISLQFDEKENRNSDFA